MSRQDILKILHLYKKEVADEYKISKIGIFGSTARGEANDESDAALIESLISSLDELDEAECQELWVQEADKRYQAYKAGTITSKPAEAVFNDAKEMLKNYCYSDPNKRQTPLKWP